jgi:hypothetical protein
VKTMAEVLGDHVIYGMSRGTYLACRCDKTWVTYSEYHAHLEAELTAAGFGPVKAAAAGALRGAADELELPGTDAAGYYSSGDAAGYSEAERHAEVWLKDRAATIEREA